MKHPIFSPVWPETTIFLGAGATAALGFPTTATQGKLLRIWGYSESWEKVASSLDETRFCSDKSKSHLRDLLTVLGFGLPRVRLAEVTPEQQSVLKDHFPDWDDEKRIDYVVILRETYDWDALQSVIKKLPEQGEDSQFLLDLFNVLDMHIVSGLSFNIAGHCDKGNKSNLPETLTPVRLTGARNCLLLLITMLFQFSFRKLISDTPDKLEPYREFVTALTQLMKEEGCSLLRGGHDIKQRAAYLFSYAVVSMNFEPMLLWLLFNEHKEVNKSCSHITPDGRQLKLYHDLAHFMGARDIKSRSLEPWYPFNEAAVQRVNDPNYPSKRAARVGKYYFVHGCFCWRECPSCGKLIMALGDDWRVESPTLFPPLPLQREDEFFCAPRSEAESHQRSKKGHMDAIQCFYCGAMTYSHHAPLIMQTSYKGRHASFLEEIARDVRACLEKTKHVVLLGYALPPDDVIYRALLASRKTENVKCSVVVGYLGEDRWLSSLELAQYCKAHDAKDNRYDWGVPTIKSACEIFGNDNVRAYTGGIPKVFKCESTVMASVKKILYPTDFEIDCFTSQGVHRPQVNKTD